MEWCQVVKLPSATIPCFFLLLFIERKRQGLILSRIRLDRVAFGLIWLRLSEWCVCMQMDAIIAYQAIRIVPVDTNGMRWYHGIQIFPPFFPLFPLQPLLPPIIPLTPPLKQINCLRPHAKMVRQLQQLKMTTKCFAKDLSPYNPLSPKLHR